MAADIKNLKQHALEIRKRIIRLTGTKGMGHTGGSLSMVEIMTALYFNTMKIDATNPEWNERDRFLLSKGHTTPGYYSCLAEAGFFSEEDLFEGYDEINSRFQGHPDMRKTPGVDMSTGSLGQGLSIAIGIAHAIAKQKLDSCSFVLMGDGEMQEGQVWEAIMYAGYKKVTNLVAIVDNNGLQLTSDTPSVISLAPLAEKLSAFGWKVWECDGHDVGALADVLDEAKEYSKQGPAFVIANTVKGKGISFIENRVEWHSKAPSKEEMKLALEELE